MAIFIQINGLEHHRQKKCPKVKTFITKCKRWKEKKVRNPVDRFLSFRNEWNQSHFFSRWLILYLIIIHITPRWYSFLCSHSICFATTWALVLNIFYLIVGLSDCLFICIRFLEYPIFTDKCVHALFKTYRRISNGCTDVYLSNECDLHTNGPYIDWCCSFVWWLFLLPRIRTKIS